MAKVATRDPINDGHHSTTRKGAFRQRQVANNGSVLTVDGDQAKSELLQL